ncbi:MAG: peptidoglycan editing factor PgeF [Rhabdochlamydiaceae bacterium]
MIRKKQGEIEWLEFDILAGIPGVVHAIFLRHGGVSEGPYQSLNLGGGTGDDLNKIGENRRRILKALNMEKWIGGKQVHGDTVAWVKQADQEVGDCDGLITDRKEIGLMIKHADCQAAIFYDPIHHAVANVHSGWRGNVKNIYGTTVQKMGKTFGSKPEDLLVGISPSLGPSRAEFINYQVEFPQTFWGFQVQPTYFDLWEIARFQLETAGVLPYHIEIAKICTHKNSHDFFSYRRDKTTGRNATLVTLL